MSLEQDRRVFDTIHDDGQAIGRFTYDVAQDAWWWSDTTYRIHGFEPGEVVPTTRLVLAHKHPDDRRRFAGVFAEACRTGEPFVSVHRIMAATGLTRNVVLAGAGRPGADGPGPLLTGCFADVTEQVLGAATQLADEQIQAATRSRATIEQAKGVLSVVWGVTPDAAFDRLRTMSMRENVPVRDLARDAVARASVRAARQNTGRPPVTPSTVPET